MKTKHWHPFGAECSYCGSDAVEVFTDSGTDYMAYDGDEAKCTECGLPGQVVITDDFDGIADVDWHDEKDCNCDWCKSHKD